MSLSPFARTALRWFLATTAVLCTIFTSLSILATLAAGTLQMDGDYPNGSGHLLGSSAAVVRFDGIIPAGEDGQGYDATLLWFLNAFGFERRHTDWDKSCGIVHNTNGFMPGPRLTLPEDLGLAANRMSLPQEDYACLDEYNGNSGLCLNEFLAAFDSASPRILSFDITVPLFLYYSAGIFLFSLGVREIIMKSVPDLLQCRCPAFITERNWCSCLKDGEKFSSARRTTLRVRQLILILVVYATGSLMLGYQGMSLVRYLEDVDAQVGGMKAQIGRGFIISVLGTMVTILVSILCLKLRVAIQEERPWMYEQAGGEVLFDELAVTDNEENQLDASQRK